jgi:hypothetical protein
MLIITAVRCLSRRWVGGSAFDRRGRCGGRVEWGWLRAGPSLYGGGVVPASTVELYEILSFKIEGG